MDPINAENVPVEQPEPCDLFAIAEFGPDGWVVTDAYDDERAARKAVKVYSKEGHVRLFRLRDSATEKREDGFVDSVRRQVKEWRDYLDGMTIRGERSEGTYAAMQSCIREIEHLLNQCPPAKPETKPSREELRDVMAKAICDERTRDEPLSLLPHGRDFDIADVALRVLAENGVVQW